NKYASYHTTADHGTSSRQSRCYSGSGQTNNAQAIEGSKGTYTANSSTKGTCKDFGDCTFFDCSFRVVHSSGGLIYNIYDLLERVHTLKNHVFFLFHISAHKITPCPFSTSFFRRRLI